MATSKKDTADAAPATPVDIPAPAAGGCYTADPATGALTLVQAATVPSVASKTQDPETGAITKTLTPE